mmetsp:Transcript_101096/g.218300  ORF Transcript_101096/g.218300 Transcript_101096/m.218300 type:complete len:270 (-) Transcript_101096:1316-2125(-)
MSSFSVAARLAALGAGSFRGPGPCEAPRAAGKRGAQALRAAGSALPGRLAFRAPVADEAFSLPAKASSRAARSRPSFPRARSFRAWPITTRSSSGRPRAQAKWSSVQPLASVARRSLSGKFRRSSASFPKRISSALRYWEAASSWAACSAAWISATWSAVRARTPRSRFTCSPLASMAARTPSASRADARCARARKVARSLARSSGVRPREESSWPPPTEEPASETSEPALREPEAELPSPGGFGRFRLGSTASAARSAPRPARSCAAR